MWCLSAAGLLLSAQSCCLILVEKGSSDLVHEADVLHKVLHQVGVLLVSAGIPLSHPNRILAKQVDPLVSCFVSHLVSNTIGLGDRSLVDHLLGSMAFNLGDADGSGGLGLDKVEVEFP